jgi:hypothetical protein
MWMITAGLVAGFIAGCVVVLTVTSAVVSRSQQHMQRKVRYWQSIAARRSSAREMSRLSRPGMN